MLICELLPAWQLPAFQRSWRDSDGMSSCRCSKAILSVLLGHLRRAALRSCLPGMVGVEPCARHRARQKVEGMKAQTPPTVPRKHRQQLLTANSLKILSYSCSSFFRAAAHPYVLGKVKTLAKPILITSAVVYLGGLLLISPIELIAHTVQLLSLGRIRHDGISATFGTWIRESVTLVPLLAMILLRNYFRKPLFKCFIHLLQEVNPPVAQQIENGPPLCGSAKRRSRKGRLSKIVDKMALLMFLELGVYILKQLPYVGRLFLVMSHYYTMQPLLGQQRGVVLSLLGFIPLLEPWVLKFVQLWRASSVLGAELLTDYISHCVPAMERADFHRVHDVTIVLFTLPHVLLMQVPILGPLLFIPAQAAAAFLVDELVREQSSSQPPVTGTGELHKLSQTGESSGSGPASYWQQSRPSAPTLPSGPDIYGSTRI